MTTGIQWTDETWNPVLGCTHVSEGCDHCYAARETSGRLSQHPLYKGLAVKGRFTGEVRLVEERLDKPFRWRKPRMVFVNSMSDLFHDSVPQEFIERVFIVMARTPQHTYQILTKRPGRMASILNQPGARNFIVNKSFSESTQQARQRGWLGQLPFDYPAWPLPNVWIGTSVETQKWADVRIPNLLKTPAAVRFLSCEPLLGPLDLAEWMVDLPEDEDGAPYPDGINWVIAGGESGPGARRLDMQWVRDIVESCRISETPVFVKQLGSNPGFSLKHSKGGDPDEWPKDLRVREWPSTSQSPEAVSRSGSQSPSI